LSHAFGSADAKWVAFGTNAGVLGLVDVRFGVVAAAWRHPSGAAAPVDAVDVAAGVAGIERPLVWAAAGDDEIALWDVAAGTCRHALKVGRTRRARDEHAMDDAEFTHDVAALSNGGRLLEAPRASAFRDWAPVAGEIFDSSPSPALVYRADELRDAPPGSEGARCVLALPSGAVLSGGSDACVRLWCPGDASRSRVVAGPLAPHDRPRYEERRTPVARVPDSSLVPVLRETPPALSARHALRGRLAGPLADGTGDGVKDTVSVAETVASAAARARHDCHRDAVLAMCVAGTGAARALVTCGRDAAVKVWK
jgi:phosphoinositide-3-kinase regulatory subunit 4